MINQKEKCCQVCNKSFDEILEDGTVGCSNCYHEFAEQLEPLIKSMQNGNLRHKESERIAEQIYGLQTAISEALEQQDYPLAATLDSEMRLLIKSQEEV